MKRSLIPLAILLISALIITACSSTATTPPASTAAAITATPSAAATTAAASTAPAATASIANKPAASSPVASPASPSGTKKYGGVFRDVTASGPGAPIGAPWLANSSSFAYVQSGEQTLLKEQADASLTPCLASSYDLVTDPASPSINFHLQKGIKFADGTDFNAQAVKWNLDMQMSPGSTNLGSTTNWKSVEVLDDYTIRVNLKTWQNIAVRGFADGVSFIVSPTAFQKNGADWMMWNIVGTGPFMQKGFQRDVSLTYAKNTNYWEQGKPYLDGVLISFVTDSMTAQALFKSGGAERVSNSSDLMAYNMQNAGYRIIKSQIGSRLTLYPDSANTDSAWSNLKVRLAAEYAMDKEGMAQALGFGGWTTYYQYYGSNSPAYDPALTPRKYDVAKAKQLLTDAGYPNGFKTTIIVSPQGVDPNIATALQANWAAVGIKADIQLPMVAAYGAIITGTWKNSIIMAIDAQAASPLAGWNAILSPGNSSFKSMKRPDGWDDLYKAAAATTKLDPALVQKAEDALYNDATEIMVYAHSTSWTVADYVMDSGIGTRGAFTWWEPQNMWLNK